MPGRNALFLKLNLEFEQNKTKTSSHPLLKYRLQKQDYQPGFGLLDLALQVFTTQGFIAKGELQAFVRKDIKPLDSDRFKALFAYPTASLSNKVALVIGASRGLGAALVRALVMQGCHVLLNFRSRKQEAENLQHELRGEAGSITLMQGDAASNEWCASTQQYLLQHHQGLDLLICNACTPPFTLSFSQHNLQRMQDYINDNLALVSAPLTTFLDLLEQKQGALVGISSSIVESDTKEWPHYRSLKITMEGLLQSAAASYNDVVFHIVRPPALLTEMSNTPGRLLGAIAPEIVAAALIDQLSDDASPTGIQIINDFSGKQIESAPQTPQRNEKIAIAATFTAEPLEPAVTFWGEPLQRSLVTESAPYNQVFQALLNPQSALLSNSSGMNVILLRFQDWLRERVDISMQQQTDFLDKTLDDFIEALTSYNQTVPCHTLLLLCPASAFYWKDKHWFTVFQQLAERLTQALGAFSSINLVNAEHYHDKYNITADIDDPVRDELGHIPFTAEYFNFLGTLIVRHFHALTAKPYKVIVVDCDNTLWDGVCGEVGATGVSIDRHYRVLQQFLLKQQQQGMLICLCSKNSEEDVWQVFDTQRDNMPLKREHMVDYRINWSAKSANIKSLATALNLGLDSFIFIDDNPVEIAEVSSHCPQVLTLQWPQSPEQAQRYLDHLWAFDHIVVTQEDQKRTELYRANLERNKLQESTTDFSSFLQSLNLNIDIQMLAQGDLARVAQLTQRTNQFNFTTLRRTESEIQQLLDANTHACYSVRVEDRFGSYGLVGVLIVSWDEKALILDTFLLSCRVLGRGVEHRMLAELSQLAGQRDLQTIRIDFNKTAKNTPARQFLQELGEPTQQDEQKQHLSWLLSSEAVAAINYQPDVVNIEEAKLFSVRENATTRRINSNRSASFTQHCCRIFRYSYDFPTYCRSI